MIVVVLALAVCGRLAVRAERLPLHAWWRLVRRPVGAPICVATADSRLGFARSTFNTTAIGRCSQRHDV